MKDKRHEIRGGLLQEISNATLLHSKEVLTTHEAALFTGLSESHIYKLACRKAIPYYKSGGGKLIYFKKSDLETWMLHRRVKSAYEIEREAGDYTANMKGGAL